MTENNSQSPVEKHFSQKSEPAITALQKAEPELKPWKRGGELLGKITKFLGLPGGLAILGILLGPGLEKQIAEQGPLYELLNQLNNNLASTPAGEYFLDVLAHLSQLIEPDIVSREEGQLIQFSQFIDWFLTFGGSAYVLGKATIPPLFKKSRNERVLEGTEPVPNNENPDRIIIGPTELVSDFASMREKADRLVVAIHNNTLAPDSLGKTIDYHFPADFQNLISQKLFNDSGLDRAKELTFLCIDPDKGIFYDQDAQSELNPLAVSQLLRQLPKEKIAGMKVGILLSRGLDFLGKTTSLIEEFKHLENELGIEIHWQYLEEVALDEFAELINEIKNSKINTENQDINIVLAGEGGREIDRQMLIRFENALKNLDIKVNVTVINNHTFGEINIDLLRKKGEKWLDFDIDEIGQKTFKDIINYLNISQEDAEKMRDLEPIRTSLRRKLLEKTLQQSDLNIVLGDTDNGTRHIAELLIKARGAERKQTVCIFKGNLAIKEAVKTNLQIIPLYQRAFDALK